MNARAELHDIIDAIDERDAIVLLTRVREIVQDCQDTLPTPVPMSERGKPHVIPGIDLRTTKRKSVSEIAAEQGVSPIKSIDELRGDFWPEDEGPDDFVNAVREWRREGGVG